MATEIEREYLGRDGTEQLVAKVKALLSNKQDSGDYVSPEDVDTIINAFGAISCNTQTLTDAQKQQARGNLGIDGVVLDKLEVDDDGNLYAYYTEV